MGKEMPADNDHIGSMAAVTPQENSCIISNFVSSQQVCVSLACAKPSARCMPPSGQQHANWLSDKTKGSNF
jgi:hypothetical protein